MIEEINNIDNKDIHSLNIKYSAAACILNIDGNIYHYNLDFYNPIKKELTFIIKNNLNNEFYLYDILIKNLSLITAKESFKEIGKSTKVVQLKLVNKYYQSVVYIKPKDYANYNIKYINNEITENITKRQHYYKLKFSELNFIEITTFPLYFCLDKFYVNLNTIFSCFEIIKTDKVLEIENKKKINEIESNGHIENFLFYFDKKIADMNFKYNVKSYIITMKILLKELLKQYSFLLEEKDEKPILNKSFKEYFVDKNNLNENQTYFLSVLGYSILNNEIFVSKIENNENTIFELVVEKGIFKISYLKDKKKKTLNKDLIDGENISIHSNLENAMKIHDLKRHLIIKYIKYIKKEEEWKVE